jgi:hypothetical protein
VNLGRKHPFVSQSPSLHFSLWRRYATTSYRQGRGFANSASQSPISHLPSPISLDANSCHLVTDPAIVIEVRLMTIFTNKFSLTPLPIEL